MPFRSAPTVPSVKTANKSQPPPTIRLKGWLNKQKHGKYKAWLRRYFVLYGEELRYYKNKNDTNALAVISLDHYSIVPNAQPFTSLNQKQCRYHTFCLISDDETKFDWPDYFLQAENDCERDDWVDNLHQHVTQSKSVLEKWLDRLDMPAEDLSVMTSIYSYDDKTIDTSLSTSQFNRDLAGLSFGPSLPFPRTSIRNHKSVESLGTFATMSTASVSDISKRRPSDFSSSLSTDLSSKIFSSKVFNWTRTKSSASSISSSRSISASIINNHSNEFLAAPHTPLKPIESPIIHPSEYNRDDEPMDHLRINQEINNVTTNNDHIAPYCYAQQDMYKKEATTI